VVGQQFMTIFKLVEFGQDRSITVYSQGPVFGRVACSCVACVTELSPSDPTDRDYSSSC
jgi:hypothetical protein